MKIISFIIFTGLLFGADNNLLSSYVDLLKDGLENIKNELENIHYDFIGAYSKLIIILYLIGIGYSYIFGEKKYKSKDIFNLGLVTPILLSLSLNNVSYDKYIISPILDFGNQLTSAIMGINLTSATDSISSFEAIGDGMYSILNSGFNDLDKVSLGTIAPLFIGITKIICGLMVILSMAIIITRAIVFQFIYLWVLSFILWLAPFQGKPRSMVFETFKQIFSYTLQMPALALVMVIFNQLLVEIINDATANPINSLSDSMFVVLVSYALFKILDQIAEIPNTITGGQSNSGGGSMMDAGLMGGVSKIISQSSKENIARLSKTMKDIFKK